MQWRVTLAVAVLCVGCVCRCVGADAMSRAMVPRDYGVKLCGREFIRAVIFTCGGSRWKRSTDGASDSLWSDVVLEDEQQIWQPEAEKRSPLPADPSYSLTDLLSLFREAGERQQWLAPDAPVRLLQQRGESSSSRSAELPSSKKKRNFSLGVAGMCCSQGCTKNDIGRLC